MPSDPLYLLCALVAVGVAVQWGAARLRIPAILPLLGVGLLLGPATGLLEPDALFGDLLAPGVKVAVAVVLFEGGLSLRFSEARRLGAPLVALVLGGLVGTFSLAAWFAHGLAGLSWPTSVVLAAILVVTGPTVIKPMLRHSRLARRPALLLKWESIVNDALGAVLAVVLLEIAVHEGEEAFPGGRVALFLVTSVLIGFTSGRFLGIALQRAWIPEHLKAGAILGGALAAYAGSEALFHEAGLLSVTVMGVVLANMEAASVEDIRRFKEEVATLLVALLFLVLAARLGLEDLKALTGGALAFVAAVLFVVRPVAVWGATCFLGLPWRERALLGWIAPRGVVAAAVGGALEPRLLAAGHEDARMLVPILFAVVICTVVLHGLTVAPLARRLGLAARSQSGLLVVGISRWTIELARRAAGIGLEVVLVDPEYRNVSRARMVGLEGFLGEVLDEDDLDELPLERVTHALVATQDDHYNAIASLALGRHLGRDNVVQIPFRGDQEERDASLHGRITWGPAARFETLTARAWSPGSLFQSTGLQEDRNDWEQFQRRWPGATPLLAVSRGRLTFLGAGQEPPEDARILFLARSGQEKAIELPPETAGGAEDAEREPERAPEPG